MSTMFQKWFIAVLWIALPTVSRGRVVTPQYIFNPNQPPEFPNCDARYAGVCAVQVSIGLVQAVLSKYCAGLASSNTSAVLQKIQSGEVLQDTPGTNFGVLVFDHDTGARLVDTMDPNRVGSLLDDKTLYADVGQPTLLPRFQAAVDVGGRFVPHLYRWTTGGNVVRVLTFVKSCSVNTGHIIGVTIGMEPLPQEAQSTAGSISFGAVMNVRRVVGLCTIDILAAQTKQEMEDVFYDITYSDKYKVPGGFYIFMYKAGTQDSLGLEAVGDTRGINVAHGVIKAIIGRNISEHRTKVGASQGLIDQGHELDLALANAAVTGGKWVDYLWGPVDTPYWKLAFTVGVKVDGTKYYLGSGFKMVPEMQVQGPACSTCSSEVSMPCAMKNSLILASAALARLLTSIPEHEAWATISASPEYKADDGFFVFAYDYNGTCMAHGADSKKVGKNIWDILTEDNIPIDGHALNARFVNAADSGGSWVKYAWQDPGGSSQYDKVAYIAKLYKYTRNFYLGVAFNGVPAPKPADCSASYAEPCAEVGVSRVVGIAAAALITAKTSAEVQDVLLQTAKKEEPFADINNGFEVRAYTSDYRCHAAVQLENLCPPTLTEEEVLAIQPAVQAQGGWVKIKGRKDRMAYVLPVEAMTVPPEEVILVSMVQDNNAPRCTGGCPEHSTCRSDRCECDFGWRPTYEDGPAVCGDLNEKVMTCVDDRLNACTYPGMGIDPSTDTCEPCAPGKYKPSGLMIKKSPCLPCPKGSFSVAQQASECTSCQPGTFSDTLGETVCLNCLVGYISDTRGLSACFPCAPGSFGNGTGQSLCSQCPTGTMGNGSGQTSCYNCPAGTAMPAEGAKACADCLEGTFQADEGATGCVRCEIGKYALGTNNVVCSACKSGYITEFFGAGSPADCKCPAGTYEGASQNSCLDCPEGMTCAIGSSLINIGAQDPNMPSPKVLEGYWSAKGDPLSIFKCQEEGICSGGPPESCSSPSMEGRMCGGCQKDYRRSGADCVECSDIETSAALFPLLPILLGPGIVWLLYNRMGDEAEQWGSWRNGFAALGLLLLGHYQCIALIRETEVQITNPLREFWAPFSYSNDLLTILSPECAALSLSNFKTGFIVRVLGPLLLLVVFVEAYLLLLPLRFFDLGHMTMDPDRLFNVYCGLLYTFYIGIVKSSMSLFVCVDHPNGESTLASSPSVLCGEGEWEEMIAIAVISLVVFCLASFSLFVYIIIIAPAHFHKQTFRRRWKFLIMKFRAQYWWWGIPWLVKGLLVNMALLFNSTFGQLNGIFFSMTAYLCLTVSFKAWRHRAANILELLASTSVIVAVYLALANANFPDEKDSTMPIAAICSLAPIIAVLPLGIGLLAKASENVKNFDQHRVAVLNRHIRHSFQAFSKLAATEALGLLERLASEDRRALVEAADILLSESLGQQPRHMRFSQRLILYTDAHSTEASQAMALDHAFPWVKSMTGFSKESTHTMRKSFQKDEVTNGLEETTDQRDADLQAEKIAPAKTAEDTKLLDMVTDMLHCELDRKGEKNFVHPIFTPQPSSLGKHISAPRGHRA